ncbi:MAG: glutamate synthase subunit beta [Actinobacteria bacterium]|nr:glutamate synthase subunit beta [Actinomycetota bacterium]
MSTFSIAIVGAGPAGYFAAQALQNLQTDQLKFKIDMIEKLPTPWGLVRSGVAPDHPKIKTVSKVFEKIATTVGFQLFCNVELGKDISTDELTSSYDAVIIATGSSIGRKLNIPGENLRGSLSAADFVPWYNAHPDYVNVEVPLDTDTAVVIGAGNVAMDVARMLALEPRELDITDTALHALDALHNSKIRTVHVFGRRGPEHAAFTSPELRELPKLEHTNVVIDKEEIKEAIKRAKSAGEIPKDVKSNLDAMMAIAINLGANHERTLNFHFLASPIEIKGEGKVEEIIFAVNKVQDGKAVQTEETFAVKAGLFVSAIGYESEPVEGIPYSNGKVENVEGRVSGTNIYVVGWAKRGPSGVIGTNKSDSATVIEHLVSDLREPKMNNGIINLLKERGVVHISQGNWEKLNSAEVAAGSSSGKPRIKFIDRKEMLGFADSLRP